MSQYGGREKARSRARSRSPRPRIGRKHNRKSPVKSRKRSYFNKGNKLTDENRKYCRCVYHVAAQQTGQCLEQRNWGKTINGKKCYNPYAICTKSTHRQGQMKCFKDTHLSHLPTKELSALAHLKRMTPSRLKLKHLLEL